MVWSHLAHGRFGTLWKGPVWFCPLTERVSTGLSSHLPTHSAVHCQVHCWASRHDTVPPAACCLALSGNFCILITACGKYGCSPMSPVDLRKLSKHAFSPPWSRQSVFLSRSLAMLATVAKLLSGFLKKKHKSKVTLPSKQFYASQVLPVFSLGHPLKNISVLSNLSLSAHRFLGRKWGKQWGRWVGRVLRKTYLAFVSRMLFRLQCQNFNIKVKS